MDDGRILGLFLGVLGGLGLVAMVGGFLHYRRERMLTHKERMRALELGRPWEEAEERKRQAEPAGALGNVESPSLARKCFSTALWVAFWGFVSASGASSQQWSVSLAIALSTGAIGVTAFVCGTILAALERRDRPVAHDRSKSFTEEDAFDVVSRRG